MTESAAASEKVSVSTFTNGLLGPRGAHARPGPRRRCHRSVHRSGLLGADDQPAAQRRARGDSAGLRGKRRARRRACHQNPGRASDVRGHGIGTGSRCGRILFGRSIRGKVLSGVQHHAPGNPGGRDRSGIGSMRQMREARYPLSVRARIYCCVRRGPDAGRDPEQRGGGENRLGFQEVRQSPGMLHPAFDSAFRASRSGGDRGEDEAFSGAARYNSCRENAGLP